mmetsp:Transcript_25528/g.61501  ORF Transcript_25528/g.61501 Transcript_25528/m.61501 type:complete len:185 (-) Transcript_25528:242-796(-)
MKRYRALVQLTKRLPRSIRRDLIWEEGDEEDMSSSSSSRSTSPVEKERQKYRFRVGDRVWCSYDGWKQGEIICIDYTEEAWEPSRIAPYQVRLFDGELIYVPEDKDMYVREKVPGMFDETQLRFKVGTRVSCQMGKEWESGVVVAFNHKENDWVQGHYAAYRVLLDDNRLVWVPFDNDTYCRRA